MNETLRSTLNALHETEFMHDGKEYRVWYDFDSGELRFREHGAKGYVALDEDDLDDRVGTDHVTPDFLRPLIVAAYHQPGKFGARISI